MPDAPDEPPSLGLCSVALDPGEFAGPESADDGPAVGDEDALPDVDAVAFGLAVLLGPGFGDEDVAGVALAQSLWLACPAAPTLDEAEAVEETLLLGLVVTFGLPVVVGLVVALTLSLGLTEGLLAGLLGGLDGVDAGVTFGLTDEFAGAEADEDADAQGLGAALPVEEPRWLRLPAAPLTPPVLCGGAEFGALVLLPVSPTVEPS